MSEAIRTIVQLVLINDTGDSYYRMRWPGIELARRFPNWRVINLAANARERFSWSEHADLLVLFQSQDYDLIPLIERRRSRGLKTLVEYNDNFYDPPPWSPVAGPWSSPLIWQSYETLLGMSDGLMVTGPGLEKLFRPRTSAPIHKIVNHYPHDIVPWDNLEKRIEREIHIGWAGSLGHMADLLAMAPIFRRLVDRFPQVHIHLMGNESIPQHVGLPPDRLTFRPWGSMDDYFEFWKPIHIGVAPLLDTAYNRCRSDIKAVEIGAAGALPVLQRALPYDEFIATTNVPTFGDFRELESVLNDLLRNPSEIRKHLDTCYRYISSSRIERLNSARADLYSSLLPELTPPTQVMTWPEKPGYYELSGTAEQQTQTAALLVQVQTLWNQKRREEALVLATKGVNANPKNPEWSLALAKCLAAAGHPALDPCVENHRKNFPRDLRIEITKLTRLPSFTERAKAWDAIFERIELDMTAKDTFRADILRQFISDLRRSTEFLPIAQQLITLLPDSPELRLALAETLERTGNEREALIHFDWLIRAAETYRHGNAFFSNTDAGYFKAWASTLRARHDGK